MRKTLPIVLLLALGAACSMPPRTNPNLLKSELPFIAEVTPTGPLSEGSLWQDRSTVGDLRASRLNDLVTIRISESTNAISRADVTTNRDGSNSLTMPGPTFLGGQSTATRNAFKGNGTTGRSAVFTTMVTARVVKVLNNGNLIFEGARDIQLNNETQRLYVAGVIDPLMLAKDNSIMSGHVSDLRIGYGGSGIVDETLKPGVVSRLLNFIWPF
jgi:flagellar L-ring protein precursor FlgH